ncbi:MAG: hypothetical protein JWL63_2396 [Rhodocyclales bacterium]|nr:hypothetical protein [Rhodocyclales bacterium]
MNKILSLLVSLALLASSNAHAFNVDISATPVSAGMNNAVGLMFFRIAEPQTCINGGAIWISLDTQGVGKGMYATVLAAITSGRKLAYLGYSQDSGGNCYAYQVEIGGPQ